MLEQRTIVYLLLFVNMLFLGVKVKKVDRQGLMRGIESGIDLKPADTRDASAPIIDGMTN